jgi:hypothetical protein
VYQREFISFLFLIGGPHRTVQPFSDEDASIETMSHCSGYSDPSSFAEDGRSFKCIPVACRTKMTWEFLYMSYSVPFPNLLFSLLCYSVGFYSVGPEVLDEEGTQEDLEYKLKGLIDLTLDKR